MREGPLAELFRATEAAQRQAEQDRVCVPELVDEQLRKLPRGSLCGRVLFAGDVPC
jgi:hypothetical protein